MAASEATLVVALHGAGRRLPGLIENVDRLAQAIEGPVVVRRYDAARPVGAVREALRLLGERPFGYDPATLARSDYDRRGASRVVREVRAFRRQHGDAAQVVLVGHSLGAAMAVEVVERLAASGSGIDEVLLLDRMFFAWRWGAFFGIRSGMPELTPRGAAHVGHLHEVLVHASSLPAVERFWVSMPAGGHAPLDAAVASGAGSYRREWAPRELGHGALAWWTAPFEGIASRVRIGRSVARERAG